VLINENTKKKRVLEEVEATVKQCVVPVDAGLEAI
jgi:hypothetical protein